MNIRLRIIGSVAHLTLDDPKTRNALNDVALVHLRDHLNYLATLPEVTVVVLRGAAGTFCSGGSKAAIGELAALTHKPNGRRELFRRVRDNSSTIETILQQPQLTIALLEGATVGAGLGIAGSCDLRFATEDAAFIPAFGTLGLSTDLGTTAMLIRHLGPGMANAWLQGGTRWDAETARKAGFLSTVSTVDDLESRIQKLSESFGSKEGERIARQRALTINVSALEADLDAEAETFTQCLSTVEGASD